MKTILLSLFMIMSFQALGQDPRGAYQINGVHSKITISGQGQELFGHFDIKEDFSKSILKIDSVDTSFVSTEFTGTPESFKVKGQLRRFGKIQNIILSGRYFGMINEQNFQKIILKLSNELATLNIYASQPTFSATSLHKEVQDIVQ